MEDNQVKLKLYDIIIGFVYFILLVILLVQRLFMGAENHLPASLLFILVIFGLLYIYGINKVLKISYNEYESPQVRLIIIRVVILLLIILSAVKLVTSWLAD